MKIVLSFLTVLVLCLKKCEWIELKGGVMWSTQLFKGTHEAQHGLMYFPLWLDKGGSSFPKAILFPFFLEF